MSAFDGVALPGKIPTSGSGANVVTPATLFKNLSEKSMYESRLNGNDKAPVIYGKVKKVKVEIFDLSDSSQRKKYEKLCAELFEKIRNQEVIVETSRDLVKRPDGTSYWMKYVEYVEYANASITDK